MTLDTNKLSKLLSLASSDNAHEATNALRMIKSLLSKEGMDFKDLAERMAKPKETWQPHFSGSWSPARPATKTNSYRDANGFVWTSKKDYDKYEKDRAAVLAKYGNEEKAIAKNHEEQLLHDAVAKWLVTAEGTIPEGRWSKSLDGWTRYKALKEASPRTIEAIGSAIPLPETITGSIRELGAWEERNREIELALEDHDGDGQLDLPAELRMNILRERIESGIEPHCIGEVIARLRYAVDQNNTFSLADIAEVVLKNMKNLSIPADASILDANDDHQADVQNGQVLTASERRASVTAMLSNMDTAKLSDRAIAKATGVSPTTVGNLRRKLSKMDAA